jgi:hypothetical protein
MAVEKKCNDCGKAFPCGPVNGKECWCFDRPHVLPYYTADGDCVCPECFDRRAAKQKNVQSRLSEETL